MAILFGFVPWIVYWVLIGNVPFLVAALVALASAVAVLAAGRYQGAPGRVLEIGAVATFVVVTVGTLLSTGPVIEQWMLPVSYAGIFVATAAGVITGRPFVREFAAVGQPPHVVDSEGFVRTTAQLTLIWVGTFAAMTVAASIPPIVSPGASILDADNVLGVVCYWVVPVVLLAAAVLVTRIRPDRLAAGADDVVRKTSFVAYSEAAIDELYYLAQEHANREVGAGEQAYNVKVGGSGLPLVGDESRQSWPATYKVRQPSRQARG